MSRDEVSVTSYRKFSHVLTPSLCKSLANAELYLTLAHIFRRLDLKLFETTADDMTWSDNHVLVLKGHLNVEVEEIEA